MIVLVFGTTVITNLNENLSQIIAENDIKNELKNVKIFNIALFLIT